MLAAIAGGVVADVRTNPDLKPLLGDPRVKRLLDAALRSKPG